MMMLLQLNGRMTAKELAQRLEVSTRTIYRDLDALSAAGVPVYAQRGPGGGCGLLEGYRTTLTGLTEAEVRALFSLTVSGLLAELGAEEASEAAHLKLIAALPERFQRDALRVRQRLHLDPSGWFQPQEPVPYLAMVQDAVWHSRRLRMTYRTADGTWIDQLIDPYGLVAKAGVWYVVAAVHGDVYAYRVSRIQEAGLAESTFDLPELFDLPAFWRAWCRRFEQSLERYQVTLRLAQAAAPSMVAVFGEGIYRLLSQTDPADEQGRQIITLTFASQEDAIHRLLGLGMGIEVLEPEALREQMRRIALQVATRYAASDGTDS